MNQFSQTIEVFNKVAQKVESTKQDIHGNWTTYKISEKQFSWLAGIYRKELKNITWDGQCGATVIDDNNTQYSFSYQKCRFNVPHYIPNREQYGKVYFITKISK